MNSELKEAHKKIDELFKYFRTSVRVILALDNRIDELVEHVHAQDKALDSLFELSDLDNEMSTLLGEQIQTLQNQSLALTHKTISLDEDQTEMADDITDQVDAYKQQVSRLASLVSFESYPFNSSHNNSNSTE